MNCQAEHYANEIIKSGFQCTVQADFMKDKTVSYAVAKDHLFIFFIDFSCLVRERDKKELIILEPLQIKEVVIKAVSDKSES